MVDSASGVWLPDGRTRLLLAPTRAVRARVLRVRTVVESLYKHQHPHTGSQTRIRSTTARCCGMSCACTPPTCVPYVCTRAPVHHERRVLFAQAARELGCGPQRRAQRAHTRQKLLLTVDPTELFLRELFTPFICTLLRWPRSALFPTPLLGVVAA